MMPQHPLISDDDIAYGASILKSPEPSGRKLTGGNVLGTIFAPFTLAERMGGVVYNNLALPAMGAAWRTLGVNTTSVAGQSEFGPDQAITPDFGSMEGWAGLLGVGPEGSTGLRNMTTGQELRGGNTLEAILESKGGDVEGWNQSYAGKAALIAGNMGLDPLNATQIMGGVKAAYQASKIRNILRGMQDATEVGNAQRAARLSEELDKATQATQGQSWLERFGRTMAGEEQPSDFFQKGWILNRNPEFNMAGEMGAQTWRARMGLNVMDKAADYMQGRASQAAYRRFMDEGYAPEAFEGAGNRMLSEQNVVEAQRFRDAELEAWRAENRPMPYAQDRTIPQAAIEQADPRMMRLINDTMQSMDMPSQAIVPMERRLGWDNPAQDLAARMNRMQNPPEPMRWETPEDMPNAAEAARNDLAERMRRFMPQVEPTPNAPERMAWEALDEATSTPAQTAESLADRMKAILARTPEAKPQRQDMPWEAPEDVPAPRPTVTNGDVMDAGVAAERVTPEATVTGQVAPFAKKLARQQPAPRTTKRAEPVVDVEKERELAERAKVQAAEAAGKPDRYADLDEASIRKAADVLMSERGQRNLNALAAKHKLDPIELMQDMLEPLAKRSKAFDPAKGKDEAAYLANQMTYAADDVQREKAMRNANQESYNVGMGEDGDLEKIETIADAKASTAEDIAISKEEQQAIREFTAYLREQLAPTRIGNKKMDPAIRDRNKKILDAIDTLNEEGKKTSHAAIAKLTGIDAKEIGRIRKAWDKQFSHQYKRIRDAYELVDASEIRGISREELAAHRFVESVEGEGTHLRVRLKNGYEFEADIDTPAIYAANPRKLMRGRLKPIKGEGGEVTFEMDFTKLANLDTIDHEMVHLMRRIGGFDDADWAALTKTFGKGLTDLREIEEAIARGLPKTLQHRGIWNKMKEFFATLYEALSGKRTGIGAIKRWREMDASKVPFGKKPAAGKLEVMYEEVPGDWRKSDEATEAFTKKIEGVTPSPTNVTARETLQTYKKMGFMKAIEPYTDRLKSKLLDTETYLRKYGWRTLDVINREHGMISKGQDFAKMVKGGVSKAEMEFNTLAGKNSRMDAVLKGEQALETYENGVSKVIMEKTNLIEAIINPMKKFLGEKASVDDYNRLTQLADSVAVAQRIRAERNAMLESIDMIASGKADDFDYIRLQKMGIDDPTALKEGMKVDPTGTLETLRKTEQDWEKNMILKTGDDYENALKVIEEQKAKGLLTENDKAMGVLDEVLAVERKMSRAQLDYAEASGMISKAMAARYRKSGDYYTPLERVFDEFEQRAGRGSATGGFTHQAMGSERMVMSPVGTVFDRLNTLIRKADENKVWRSTVENMAETKDTMAELRTVRDSLQKALDKELAKAAKNKTDANADTIADFEEQIRQYDDAMKPMEDYIRDTEKVMIQVTDPKDRVSTDVIPVVRDGKTTYWRFVNEDARRDIVAMMTHNQRTDLERYAQWPGKILRGSLTASPRFALFNFIRDSFMRPMVSAHGGTPWEALTQRKESAKYTEAFYRSGGAQDVLGGDMEKFYRDEMAGHIRKVAKSPNTLLATGQNLVDLVQGSYHKIQSLTGMGEKLNRLAEYKNAYEWAMKNMPGITQEDAELYAAANSRGLMDFAQGGTLIRQINKYIPFTNAAVQGSRVMIRAMMRDPELFAKNFIKYMVTPTFMTYMFAHQQGRIEEYRELPAYRRDFFWNIPIPGSKQWVAIPKAFEIGVAATFFERATDYLLGNKKAFDGYAGSLAKGGLPVDEAAILGPLKPLAEVMANRNLFYDQAIVPYWEEDLAVPLRQGAKNASGIGRAFNYVFKNTDPRYVDHLISSFLGDYGRTAVNIGKLGMESENPMTIGKIVSKAAGVVRETSPFEMQSAKQAMERQKALGLHSQKQSKAFRDILKQASQGTKTTLDAIMASRKEEERLGKITVQQRLEELLKKRKEKD